MTQPLTLGNCCALLCIEIHAGKKIPDVLSMVVPSRFDIDLLESCLGKLGAVFVLM